MQVLFWRVLIEPVAVKDKKSEGGIILPDEVVNAAAKLSMTGRVIQLGPFAFTARTSLGYNYAVQPGKPKVGDLVLVPKFGGRDLKLKDGRELKLIEDYEILAVVEPDEVLGYV